MALRFELVPVKRKPINRYTDRMYKEIIREFISTGYNLAEVNIGINNKSYVKSRLHKNIQEMKLSHKIVVSIVNNSCYLERY